MRRISFDQCAVAFLDILGFKDFITAAETPGTKESREFARLMEAVDCQLVFTAAKAQKENLFPKDVGLRVIHISDSFVLSAPLHSKKLPHYSGLVAVSIKTIQLAHELLKMGFLLRGGVAVGSVYRTNNNIFGTGYLNAYETEEKFSNHPRVLLHKSAAELLKNERHCYRRLAEFPIFMREGGEFMLDTLYTGHWSYISRDEPCGIVEIFESYQKTIERNLQELSSGPARDKWQWMARFFNAKLKDSSDLRVLSPVDLDSLSPFNFKAASEPPSTTFAEWTRPFRDPGRIVRIGLPEPSKDTDDPELEA